MLNESRTTNEITYGDEILVSLGWNLQPAASDEIKSANLTSRKQDLIALAISSTYVDLFRISGFSWKNLTRIGEVFSGGAYSTKIEPLYSFVTSYMDIFPINSCPLTPQMLK